MGVASLRSRWTLPQTFHVSIQEVERRLVGYRRRRDGIPQVHGYVVFGLVGRPFWQALAVGIAGGREVHPVSRHVVGKLPIHVLPLNVGRTAIDPVESVRNFGAVLTASTRPI